MNKQQQQSAPSGRLSPAPSGSLPEAPSDLELMMFFDGELEEPRRSVVAAFVDSDLGARSKISGLGAVQAIVQDEAESLAAADTIADLVMAKIAAEPIASTSPQVGSASGSPVLQQSLQVPRGKPAANDNGRRIFVGAIALVAAAAAAFAIWSQRPSGSQGPLAGVVQEPAGVTSSRQASLTTSETRRSTAGSQTEPEVDAAGLGTDTVESEPGVEVASVNFGAHMGSIFYVPSGSIEAKRTTTVVWLTEDGGE